MEKITTIETTTELLEIDTTTGEILLSTPKVEYQMLQTTKIKAFNLLKRSDFVKINGTWEATRDGLIKILSSLPLSYTWEITNQIISHEKQYSSVQGKLTVVAGSIQRVSDGIGICEYSELKGNGGLHFMVARAETRALKRAIETLFGSVINFYVVKYLV